MFGLLSKKRLLKKLGIPKDARGKPGRALSQKGGWGVPLATRLLTDVI